MSQKSESIDWKKTIRLPRTDFPMRGDLARREPEQVERWRKEDLYGKMLERRADAPSFVLHDGPPYANGNIHHGHALNKVLKDIVIKYRSLAGFRAPNIPGWDCHGLPIEQKVDERLGGRKQDLSVRAFREACRAYAEEWVGVQREEFRRLLVLADWENPYRTMDYAFQASILRVFADFVEGGYVYRGLKPVHWSWAARTALAEAEVEYAAYEAPSVYVQFALPAPPAFLAEAAAGRAIDVVIWTTTPWTLPSNTAIVLHPDLEYQLLALDADRAIVLAEGLRDEVLTACGLPALEVLATFRGEALVGRPDGDVPRPLARHPFVDRDSVLLPADYVTLEQGTGCVHTAPGHGQDDYQTGLRYGLPVLAPVDDRGCYTAEVAEGMDAVLRRHTREEALALGYAADIADWVGQHVFKANPLIAAHLAATGRLLNAPTDRYRVDRYPHCWRTKKPLIFRATEQWFIRVDHAELRTRCLDAISETEWIPHWGENRIRGMLETRPDWCISRQRAWGVPITAFRCRSCGADVVDARVARHVAALVEEEGADIWFDRSASELCPPEVSCSSCGASAEDFEPVHDILDVWFDSGSSWAALIRDREGQDLPVDLYLEGSDQHRGWFHTSLLTSAALRGSAPYRSVLTHGFVVDEKGHKYSKSSPTFEPLAKMLDAQGAEILRLWVAAVDYRQDVTLAPTVMRQTGDAYRKIRNTIRFLLGNIADFDPKAHPLDAADLTLLDRWALARTEHFVERIRAAYDASEFHTVFHTLLDFCGQTLSAVYLDALKDRLYCEAPDDPRRRASQAVLHRALRAVVVASAPILSFTAEEAWAFLPGEDAESVFLSDFPSTNPAFLDADALAAGDRLVALREEVNECIEALRPRRKGDREEGQLGSSQEARVLLHVAPADETRWRALCDDLRELLIVAEVDVVVAAEHAAGALPKVAVEVAQHAKCSRCWNLREDVGSDPDYPELCGRCASVIRSAPELLPAHGAE